MRDGYTIHIYDSRMQYEIATHDVTWSRKDSFCKDQYAVERPEESPTMPVQTTIHQNSVMDHDPFFDRFSAEGGDWND